MTQRHDARFAFLLWLTVGLWVCGNAPNAPALAPQSPRLTYVEVPGAAHTESAWAERFDDLLRYLYPAP